MYTAALPLKRDVGAGQRVRRPNCLRRLDALTRWDAGAGKMMPNDSDASMSMSSIGSADTERWSADHGEMEVQPAPPEEEAPEPLVLLCTSARLREVLQDTRDAAGNPVLFTQHYTRRERLYPAPGAALRAPLRVEVHACTPVGNHGAVYAVKSYGLRQQDMDGETKRQIARELDIMRALRTADPAYAPFMMTLETWFWNDGTLYMVMPYAPQTLMSLLQERYRDNSRASSFSDAEMRGVAARTLTALVYLHDKLSVVHRDIKCAFCVAPITRPLLTHPPVQAGEHPAAQRR